MESLAEGARGEPNTDAIPDRLDREPVWDGTEILGLVGAAVVDFAPEQEHRILVLAGSGTLRLADVVMELSRGLTLIWRRPVALPFEARSVEPLVMLHQVVPLVAAAAEPEPIDAVRAPVGRAPERPDRPAGGDGPRPGISDPVAVPKTAAASPPQRRPPPVGK